MFVLRNLAFSLWITGSGGAYNSFWGYLLQENGDKLLCENGDYLTL